MEDKNTDDFDFAVVARAQEHFHRVRDWLRSSPEDCPPWDDLHQMVYFIETGTLEEG